MTDWTAGYVADVGYTYGYYPELNPLRVQLAFLTAGLVPPKVGAACELGFGQGMSVNMHAAASVVQWCGTDFNPSQAGFAQEVAAASGSGARLFDEAFDQFCNKSDLPDFDYIGLHGIWSWISDENRGVIVDFVRRKLKVGGVLYVSYNTQPGWAAMVPFRDLLIEHANVMGSSGSGIVKRIDQALAFVDQLFESNPAYAKANPQVAERLKHLKKQNRNYLAHEYFNRDWQPMSFANMANWLQPAKLQWACSANFLESLDAVSLSPEQQAILADIPDPMFRQTVRDFCVNQQFRKDYWVKGARNLTALDKTQALRALRVVLVKPRADVSLTVTSGIGEISLHEGVYKPLLDQLADHRPRTLADLELALASVPIALAQLCQAVVVLCGVGALSLVQDDVSLQEASAQVVKVNRHLMERSRSNNELNYLGSPLIGGALAVSQVHQLFLLAHLEAGGHAEAWAQHAAQVLFAQGQRLVKDGRSLDKPEETLAELVQQAHVFESKQLPLLKALKVF